MSTLSVTNLKNAASATNNLVLNPDGSVNISGGTLSPQTGFKNRLINGSMTIDQRNAGASVTPTADSTYTLDRWFARLSVASKFSVQQNAGAVTPPAGYTNYLGVTSLSAYSVGASEFFSIAQAIEGFNVADLGFGTANAQTVTLSFWVRSSLTGTFGGTAASGTNNRTYPFTYTISAANTWEQKTITIVGDTTAGGYNTNSSAGFQIYFSLGAGASVSGTAGSWSGTTFRSATGATSVVGTSGATFYITGVQLEKGSTATPFEFRSIGQEEILCMRYFEKLVNGGSMAGTDAPSGLTSRCQWQFKVTKRATPTVTNFAGSTQDRISTQGFQTFASGVGTATILDGAWSSAEL